MEWSRVDIARNTAWLNQTKNGTPRGIPLNRDAVAVLEEQVGKHPRYCFTYRGQPIRYELTNSAWETACKKAELTDLRFHDLRHTHASQLLRQSTHPKVVAERLGHSTVMLTLDVYSHVVPGLQEEAARQLDRTLRKALKKRSS